ncbi:hypothetical protein D3C81_919940 [compost metagenome]
MHHFTHEGGLLGKQAWAQDVHGVEVALPDLPGGRRAVVQVDRGAIAVAQVTGVLHRVADLGAETDARQLDVFEIAQAIGRRGAIMTDALERRVLGGAGEVEEQRADTLVIAVMEQPHFSVLGDPVAHAQTPLAAVAGVFRTAITDRQAVGQVVDLTAAQTKELGAGTERIAAKIVPHRVELGLFPLVLVVAHQRQVFIQRPRPGHLPYRQV